MNVNEAFEKIIYILDKVIDRQNEIGENINKLVIIMAEFKDRLELIENKDRIC